MMLISLTISLTEINAAEPKHIALEKSDKAPEKLWCYNASNLNNLRNGLEGCEEAKIELKHLKNLNKRLIETQPVERPIWSNWWVKLPAGIALGSLAGILATKSSDSQELGAVSGAVVGTVTAVLLDFEF